MTTTLTDHNDGSDRSLLAAQYVLGTLSPAERISFQAELQQQPELRSLTHAWERRLNPLTELLVPQPVPDSVWARIEARLDAMTASPATPSLAKASTTMAQPTRRPAANDRFWLPWAWVSTGIAAGLALFVGLHPAEQTITPQVIVQQAPPPLPTRDLAVLSTDQHQAAWIVRQQGNALVLSGLNAAAVPSEHDLELWSIQGSGAPKSLGVIHIHNGQAQLPLKAAALISADTTLAISLEPKNGSPTGLPTGAVLYTGKVVSG